MKRMILAALAAFFAAAAHADGTACRVEAPLLAPKAGLVEAVLPPGLHYYSEGGLDMRVAGGGEAVPFELYWRLSTSEEALPVTEKSAQLLDNGRSRWQGAIEEPAVIKKVRAYLTAQDYVAKVDAYGFDGGSWILLAKDAALYKVEGKSRAEIPVTPGRYLAIRLEFTSYDEKYKQRPAPVDRVEAVSERSGIEYSEQTIRAVPAVTTGAGETAAAVSLPGSGIWIKQIEITTAVPFIGEWTLEQEGIKGGKREYLYWSSGVVDSLKKGSSVMKLEIDSVAKGRNLRIKLKPKSGSCRVTGWATAARLPKLVFNADRAGEYTVMAGCGEKAAVLDEPSEARRTIAGKGTWGTVKDNTAWKPEDLLEKYRIGGGPFNGRGYSWSAPVLVSGPGYYRFVLGEQGALEGYFDGLRIVRQSKQVPYFTAGSEIKEVKLGVKEEYNAEKNSTTWEAVLPRGSANWGELVLESSGIFSRRLVLECGNEASPVRETWREAQWSSLENKPARLRIPLSGLPEGASRIRITADHGDNMQIKLTGISATYSAPVICFLADSADGYAVYGGNRVAASPHYDLELVQDSLLAQEPKEAQQGPVTAYKGGGMPVKFMKLFEGKNWGLYGALGIVTLILLILIAKLFPAVQDGKKRG